MPLTILGIGLESGLTGLVDPDGESHGLISASNLEQGMHLVTQEVNTIVVDSRVSAKLRPEIISLLGKTPVTTDIIVITHPTDEETIESLSGLGIKTISSPVTPDALQSVLKKGSGR